MVFDLSTIFLHGGGYLIVFLIMIIEGPIATYAAAAASAFGIFNIWIIFLLSFLGNLLPDTALYCFGRFARTGFIERFLQKYFKLSKAKMAKVERFIQKHAKKSIFIFKITPVLPLPGLILTGFMKVPFFTFLATAFIFNLISAIVFSSLGFYSGIAVSRITAYFNLTQIIIPIIIILIVIIYVAKNRLTKLIKTQI